MEQKHIGNLLSGMSYHASERERRLKVINRILRPYSIKLTETFEVVHPVEGMDESFQDITLHVWKANRFIGWNEVARIVPGEEFPQVKDGALPEVLSIKKVVTEGDHLPSYYRGYRLGYLILEDEPIMVIRGGRIHVTLLGYGIEYDKFQLTYCDLG